VASFADEIRGLRGVNDGSAYANPEVNTTAPTMGTLAAGPAANDLEHDTVPLSNLPSKSGRSLELAPSRWPTAGPPTAAAWESSSATELAELLEGLQSRDATVPVKTQATRRGSHSERRALEETAVTRVDRVATERLRRISAEPCEEEETHRVSVSRASESVARVHVSRHRERAFRSIVNGRFAPS
jgi:hypothetical protein